MSVFVLHIALQGCLKGQDVEYGITSDTGGHIRYLLDLVHAHCEALPHDRIVIATRPFSGHGPVYEQPHERVSDQIEIIRLQTQSSDYLTKEELHTQVESFADALCTHIEANGRPDIIHAHYAIAASAAAIIKDRLGIPFVFTGHSLGLVKQSVMGSTVTVSEGFQERIAGEEIALKEASLVVASSRDEAELQYAGYRNYDPGSIRVIPPGSDLAAFKDATVNETVETELGRFLTDPQKPVILAIARPVRRKNLSALVEAFGKSKALQAQANLVLVAGTRTVIDDLDGDMAGSMHELLALIDQYDLYGKIAYPKSHTPADIPAYYAYARDRGGLFANPALNEPFGLTLLEASAAGLPIVATDSGGPNDIVETCGNGLLVDPTDPDSIAEAALRILSSSDLYRQFAEGGTRAVAHYDWKGHVQRYRGLLSDLIEPAVTRPANIGGTGQLLISDIDNTLVGSVPHLHAFGAWRRLQPHLAFGVATGRSFHSAMAVLEQEDVPRPEVMITSVGSEIYHLDENGVTYSLDRDWLAQITEDWDREPVRRVVESVTGITPQAALEQRAFKLSYFSDGSATVVKRVQAALERVGLMASVIHSHRRYLDILPYKASKGTAVEFVRQRYGLRMDSVFVAGDSGNDIEMLRAVPQSIIVANYSDGLAHLPDLKHSYLSRESHARGIMEGVDYFRRKASASCHPVS